MKTEPQKDLPELSVVMAARDEERHLGAAIESILAQTFENWELIVIDDGSVDLTPAIIRQYSGRDKRIRWERNETSRGLAVSLNRGVLMARSDIIVRADADDLSLVNRFEEQLGYLKSHPEIDFLGTAAYLIDDQGGIRGEYCLPQAHNEIKALAFKNTCFFHPSVAMRRTVLLKIGLYDPSYMRAQDKELWLRGLTYGCRYSNLKKPLIKYRVTDRSTSWRNIYRTVISLTRMAWSYQVRGWWLVCMFYVVRQLMVKFRMYKPRSVRK